MEYQHYTYSEAMQLPEYMETDISMDGFIDPNLKPSALHWTPQIQRYLTDNSKSSICIFDTTLPETVVRRGDYVPPLPSSLVQRRDSPSFSHTSSTTSSALSPPREGDYYQAHSPPTPTDTTVVSPFFQMSPNSRDQLYQLTGLADDCVKPFDINPFQETPESYSDDVNLKAEFPSRSYSMTSDDSISHLSTCCGLGLGQVNTARPMSPQGFTPEAKGEVHMPESGALYPEFDTEDEMTSGEEAELFEIKHEDDDDEYKPTQKYMQTNYNASRQMRTCKRRNSSTSLPEVKRLKTELNIPTATHRQAAKPVIHGPPKGNLSCPECPKKVLFKDEGSLNNHIKKQHTRPFICVFGFAGCKSTFASKNEWKRHCSSQHLVLNYWVCLQDQCSRSSSKPTTIGRNRPNASPSSCSHGVRSPNGTIFNRKDLYTQHLRRMHIPAGLKKQVKQRKPAPEWEAQERKHQDEAKRTRCDLPTYMRCPAANCNARFDGSNAWDERMEHVAKHLEKAVTGSEPPIEFGGAHDETLMEWATRPEIAIVERGERGKWRLRNPLKTNGGLIVGAVADHNGDEDAEGEEVEE